MGKKQGLNLSQVPTRQAVVTFQLEIKSMPEVWMQKDERMVLPWPNSLSSSVQSLSRVRLFATPWIAARQASLSITNSRSLLKLIEGAKNTEVEYKLSRIYSAYVIAVNLEKLCFYMQVNHFYSYK